MPRSRPLFRIDEGQIHGTERETHGLEKSGGPATKKDPRGFEIGISADFRAVFGRKPFDRVDGGNLVLECVDTQGEVQRHRQSSRGDALRQRRDVPEEKARQVPHVVVEILGFSRFPWHGPPGISAMGWVIPPFSTFCPKSVCRDSARKAYVHLVFTLENAGPERQMPLVDEALERVKRRSAEFPGLSARIA